MNVTEKAGICKDESTIFMSLEVLGDLITENTYHTLKDVFNGYISLLICIVGIPANLVTCLVFWRQGLRDRMNLCLFCLAAVDLLYMTSVVPVSCISAFLHISHSSYADEYFVKTVMGGVGVLLVVRVETGGAVQWRYEPTQLYLDNKEFFEAVEMSVLTVSLPMTTFLVVSVSSVITVIKLTAALKWREKTSSTSGEKAGHQTALTKMLLLVSFIYICTMIPSVSLNITRLLVLEFSPHGRYYYLFIATQIIANIFPVAHSASNFFVYYKRSSRFRAGCLGVM
ncbi:uncharacterized protein LOC112566160 [Pomacea canaliculata]|uniref:uncharacterized protein LOC112566160 n=1 Tax=Pomacea canaliculata TaxID=400727 RepID=UPI000D731075|nr:uncharacterized protein LOC112566160 [Pomacea canaliculata]